MSGADTFRDAITTFRNRSLHTYVGHCLTFRNQILQMGEFGQESGWSDATNGLLIEYLLRLDLLRQKITRNPERVDLQDLRKRAKQLDLTFAASLEGWESSSQAADDVPRATAPEMELRYALDGTDPNFPQLKDVDIKNTDARMLCAAIDLHITESTRLDSRHATYRVTPHESLMLYESS